MRAQAGGGIALAAAGCALVVFALAAAGAQAAFPGQAGKIAVESRAQLVTVHPNGGGATALAPANALDPTWSADGARIAFADGNDGGIWVVDEDGSDLTQLTTALDRSPAWSPDGTKIAFEHCDTSARPILGSIHVMNSDGTGVTSLGQGRHPAWSPDGTKIAFSKAPSGCWDDQFYVGGALWTMNPDGSGATEVVPAPSGDAAYVDMEWSPDGSKIAFTKWTSVDREVYNVERFRQVHVVNADGSGHTTLTPEQSDFGNPAWSPDGYFVLVDTSSKLRKMRSDGTDLEILDITGVDPDWQPIPGITGYPRPKGASPQDVSLVLAYEPCFDPNRQHAPPLDHDSCSPPVQASEHLTVGTFDSNGQAPWFLGRARLRVLTGDPGTPADEADVSITVDITDVRRAGDLSDYTGELRATRSLRLVDKNNGGTTAATVSDIPYSFTVPCQATEDSTGARCALETTADSLVPGTIVERTRAIWELGQLQVFDGGADEDADTEGDNTLFLVQGVFVP